MVHPGGRPKKNDKRITVSITILESAWNEYLSNNQPTNTHNRKIEQFITRDNLAAQGEERIKAQIAERKNEIAEYELILKQKAEQTANIDNRAVNRDYQKDVATNIRDFRVHPEMLNYIQDRANKLSREYNLPANIVLIDLQTGLTGKKFVVQQIGIEKVTT